MPPTERWIGQLSCINSHDDLNTLKRTIADPSFKNFAKKAYDSKDGYSIRTNPHTNKTEMFVAGARDLSQWAMNLYDGVLHQSDLGEIGVLNPWRLDKQNHLGRIAQDNYIDVVYGHSRGGALAADMPLSECTQRVGLDAAMMIAANKDIVNLSEGGGVNPLGLFDEYIGQTGQKNVTVDFSPWYPHKVWSV